MPQEEITGTEISVFPEASTIYGGDVVAGVQSGSNKKFSFATIFSWIRNTLSAAGISYDSTISGATADNIQDALDEAFSDLEGKQSTITASGILKGDGAGGVSAATSGTDYGTYSKPSGGIPASDLASGVVPSASDATPQALGTAAAGSSNDYSRADHVHQMPEIPSNVEANPAGAATDSLTKLQVDQTIYAIEGIDYLTVVNGQICVVYEVTP